MRTDRETYKADTSCLEKSTVERLGAGGMAPRELRMLPVLATDPGSVANMQIGQLPAACTLNSKGYDYLFRPSWAPAHTLNTHKQVGTFPETKNKLIFKCIVWWKSRHRDTEL